MYDCVVRILMVIFCLVGCKERLPFAVGPVAGEVSSDSGTMDTCSCQVTGLDVTCDGCNWYCTSLDGSSGLRRYASDANELRILIGLDGFMHESNMSA
jgi:hypothetical protein